MSQRADMGCAGRYAFLMGYPQGGGLTAERRAFREQIRLETAERFAAGEEDNALVAKALRVHVRSVQRRRAAWTADGEPASLSKGPATLPQIRARLGQSQDPSESRHEDVHRRARLADRLPAARLRPGPEPRRGYLVPDPSWPAGQRRVHRPRTPHRHSSPRTARDPVPQLADVRRSADQDCEP